VKTDQVILTRGSDEGIDLLVRLFCRADQDQIMICPPTYGMYRVAATIQNAGIVEVPLLKDQDFSLDLVTILQTWQPRIKLIFLCSPNNPTGNLLTVSDILSLCNRFYGKSIIVVDEAYIEFSTSDGMVKYLENCPNLVILRTLSKAHGLAGIRCGTTIANENIIKILKKIIAPYPIPEPIVTIASQQLKDNALSMQIKIIQKEREKLFDFLSNVAFVKKIWKSEANFILFEVIDAKVILAICRKNGIVLRDRSREYNLANCIRITVGDTNENKFFIEVMSRV
jgi:histidinol-phosphate aminotransferase